MKDAQGHGSNTRGGAQPSPGAGGVRNLNINDPPIAHQMGIFNAVKKFAGDTSGAGRDISGSVMKLAGADPDAVAENINMAFHFGHFLG